MELKALKEAHISRGTRVILRADFDVAVRGVKILEDFRIREVLPALRYLLRRGARVRIISHLGRPYGKVVPSLSMKKIAQYLGRTLRKNVIFIFDPLNPRLLEKYGRRSGVLFFENIRFFPGEERNDSRLAQNLAKWGDLYVNEAFANSHRRHASMAALARRLPAFAGLHLEKEISSLEKILRKPKRPLMAILGGKKLETKLPLVARFLKMGDAVLVGGALANTLLFAKGIPVGASPVEGEFVKKLRRVINHEKLLLPFDFYVAASPKVGGRPAKISEVRDGETIFDIGPATAKCFSRLLRRAGTVVWNGPLGLAERPQFSAGTCAVARALQKSRAFKVVGGGDTIAILKQYGLLRGFSHVSTGGGAMLGFLAGKKLPAIEVLRR